MRKQKLTFRCTRKANYHLDLIDSLKIKINSRALNFVAWNYKIMGQFKGFRNTVKCVFNVA